VEIIPASANSIAALQNVTSEQGLCLKCEPRRSSTRFNSGSSERGWC